MNFFEAQERSRSQTSTLLVLFSAGVVGVLASVNLLVVALLTKGFIWDYPILFRDDPWTIPGLVSLVTLLLIGCVTLVRILNLSSGGYTIAILLGAQPIVRETTNDCERRLVNVVDEMAIASGITPPEIYVLEEPSINAMAAGLEPSSAAIIINRGALETLSRDELQALVAHEFSHIFNGDMRLNVKLIGAISGIFSLHLLGRFLLRGRSSSSRGGAPIFFVGLGLLILGAVGAFFARIIQAAISRQREFLADATAVQYTRNPQALIGCFRKILGNSSGSNVNSTAAPEVSHMFFSSFASDSWFQTHPPIEDRIRAIEGTSRKPLTPSNVPPPATPAAPSHPAALAMASVGSPTPAHFERASNLQSRFPEAIRRACRSANEAESLLLATVAGKSQLTRIPLPLRDSVTPLAFEVEKLGEEAKLPIITLALATLRQLDEKSKQATLSRLKQLIEADGQYSLFEVAVLTIAEKTLASSKNARSIRIETAVVPLTTVLWSIAVAGKSAPEKREEQLRAYSKGSRKLFGRDVLFIENKRPDFRSVYQALNLLDGLKFQERQKVLEACWECALTDGVLTIAEREMMRAIHCAMDCPMPLSR
jgi:Zn-dependent protease with chaperone function/uncharacterized tellurite resistance protein B-like protein